MSLPGPLSFSVALFLAYGAVYVLIGTLTPLLHNRGLRPQILIITARADTELFGTPPADLLRDDPVLARLRSILLNMVGGLLTGAGCMVLALAWFGLRSGQAWALGALGLAGAVVLPFWRLALWPYVRAGVRLQLFDLPPFMWIPAALLGPALVLGWIGLR